MQLTSFSFKTALLEKGRRKHRNIVIVRPEDKWATFILQQLTVVFKNAIINLSSSQFPGIGAHTIDISVDAEANNME